MRIRDLVLRNVDRVVGRGTIVVGSASYSPVAPWAGLGYSWSVGVRFDGELSPSKLAEEVEGFAVRKNHGGAFDAGCFVSSVRYSEVRIQDLIGYLKERLGERYRDAIVEIGERWFSNPHDEDREECSCTVGLRIRDLERLGGNVKELKRLIRRLCEKSLSCTKL